MVFEVARVERASRAGGDARVAVDQAGGAQPLEVAFFVAASACNHLFQGRMQLAVLAQYPEVTAQMIAKGPAIIGAALLQRGDRLEAGAEGVEGLTNKIGMSADELQQAFDVFGAL